MQNKLVGFLLRPEIALLVIEFIVLPILEKVAKMTKWTDIDDTVVDGIKKIHMTIKKSCDIEKGKGA